MDDTNMNKGLFDYELENLIRASELSHPNSNNHENIQLNIGSLHSSKSSVDSSNKQAITRSTAKQSTFQFSENFILPRQSVVIHRSSEKKHDTVTTADADMKDNHSIQSDMDENDSLDDSVKELSSSNHDKGSLEDDSILSTTAAAATNEYGKITHSSHNNVIPMSNDRKKTETPVYDSSDDDSDYYEDDNDEDGNNDRNRISHTGPFIIDDTTTSNAFTIKDLYSFPVFLTPDRKHPADKSRHPDKVGVIRPSNLHTKSTTKTTATETVSSNDTHNNDSNHHHHHHMTTTIKSHDATHTIDDTDKDRPLPSSSTTSIPSLTTPNNPLMKLVKMKKKVNAMMKKKKRAMKHVKKKISAIRIMGVIGPYASLLNGIYICEQVIHPTPPTTTTTTTTTTNSAVTTVQTVQLPGTTNYTQYDRFYKIYDEEYCIKIWLEYIPSHERWQFKPDICLGKDICWGFMDSKDGKLFVTSASRSIELWIGKGQDTSWSPMSKARITQYKQGTKNGVYISGFSGQYMKRLNGFYAENKDYLELDKNRIQNAYDVWNSIESNTESESDSDSDIKPKVNSDTMSENTSHHHHHHNDQQQHSTTATTKPVIFPRYKKEDTPHLPIWLIYDPIQQIWNIKSAQALRTSRCWAYSTEITTTKYPWQLVYNTNTNITTTNASGSAINTSRHTAVNIAQKLDFRNSNNGRESHYQQFITVSRASEVQNETQNTMEIQDDTIYNEPNTWYCKDSFYKQIIQISSVDPDTVLSTQQSPRTRLSSNPFIHIQQKRRQSGTNSTKGIHSSTNSSEKKSIHHSTGSQSQKDNVTAVKL